MRIAGQSIIKDARNAAMANILKQDMPFYDLQGENPVITPAQQQQTPASAQPQQSQGQTSPEEAKQPPSADEIAHQEQKMAQDETSTRVRSTGDIISRLSGDASMVGDALTRELTVSPTSILWDP